MQTVYTSEQIAQWVIDNRYPKSENEKVTDFEMYHEIVNRIDDKGQPSAKPTEAVLLSKEDADRVKELLNTIYQNIRSVIPTHIDFDSVNDVALYNSFHKVGQAIYILNKSK